jgi:arabinosaccharide transport system substrate-binding protein
MSFPLGKPILVLLLIALLTGGAILLQPQAAQRDMTMWIFAASHAKSYRDGDPASGTPGLDVLFEQKTGQSVRIDLVAGRALDMRLISLFMTDAMGDQVPDLVEIEIGSVGKFFRPPLQEVGLLPLNDLIERDGLMDQMVPARLAPWTKEGAIFGIPHDVHPVTLSYRADLYAEAGLDPSQARTWAEFHEIGRQYVRYWHGRGETNRWAIELPSAAADMLSVMLMQRGINPLDDHNRVLIGDPKVAQTIALYATMVAGPKRIAADATPGGMLWTQDFARGSIAATITPDWKAGYLAQHGGSAAGKARMMPLPRFEPSDTPTSTWGGTMVGIPRRAKDPAASWELLKFIYFSNEGLAARERHTQILPPIRSRWSQPIYDQPSVYFGGQRIGALYRELADQIPRRYVTPYTALGTQSLATVLNKAVDHVRTRGESGLVEACQRWLNEEAEALEKRVAFGTFE